MDVLITGGAGFIGSHLVKHHLNLGDTVYLIDDLSTGSIANLNEVSSHPNLHAYFSDLHRCKELRHILESCQLVYHFAAVVGVFRVLQQPEQVLSVNIGATQYLLELMREISSSARIIFASSSEVYGSGSKELLSEEHDLVIAAKQPHRMNYAISKLVDEAYALTYFETYGIQSTVLRIFNVIGPNQSGHYGMVIPRFIQAAITQQPLEIYGTGHQKRSFCDVRDFVFLMDAVAKNPNTIGQVLNIGHLEEVSILELAKQIIRLTQSTSELKYLPYEQVYGEWFDDFKYRRPDLTKLKQYIPVNYQWNLERSLKDLIARAQSS
jgi:UDP-glucose 4-epimerase